MQASRSFASDSHRRAAASAEFQDAFVGIPLSRRTTLQARDDAQGIKVAFGDGPAPFVKRFPPTKPVRLAVSLFSCGYRLPFFLFRL